MGGLDLFYVYDMKICIYDDVWMDEPVVWLGGSTYHNHLNPGKTPCLKANQVNISDGSSYHNPKPQEDHGVVGHNISPYR